MVTKPDFLGLLGALHRHRVEYVVVGGVAAILEGAPIATIDLDIVFSTDTENVGRLAGLLSELDARYRDPAGRLIRPTAARLQENSINLLETDLGLLDAMQQIGAGWTFDDLLSRSHVVDVGNTETRVLGLDSVIESKEVADREKDRAMLPTLRSTLEVKRGD